MQPCTQPRCLINALIFDCAHHLFSHSTQGDYDLAIRHFEFQ